ncbi:uncharacterized protein A4U43_C08F1450 [Asparagus officinalis]|uniref:transcription factor MYB39-like n=1 Tax=Asparagus officinalis TaxID=4686 RepID=UPI00098E4231|nr:transcription factor MYB39-like [Asparagus officinalis]ONK58955.1 uncharacterized protein A4U43_C08F1450 [Asparagus officinalis]
MGRTPCCEADANVKKGPWTTEEDKKLMDYIEESGAGSWRHLPKRAGLNRCGKSCRLRWTNYLRPDIRRGRFSEEEERLIIHLHSLLGNKWSAIANQLPGRTDNEIKNYWNTHIRKKLLMMGIDPVTHRPRTDLNLLANLPNLIAAAANLQTNYTANPLMNALQLPKLQLLQTLIQAVTNPPPPNLGSTGLPRNLNQTSSGVSNLGMQQMPNVNLQALLGSDVNTINRHEFVAPLRYDSCNSSDFGPTTTSNTATTSFMSTPTANSAPSLVSASPENYTVDQAPELVNCGDVSSSSPISKPFEQWSGLTLDDLDSDLGWKDILDQLSWSNPLEQEMDILKN